MLGIVTKLFIQSSDREATYVDKRKEAARRQPLTDLQRELINYVKVAFMRLAIIVER